MNALEIKENRKKLGFTQLQLAKIIGVSLKTISNYENGEVIPESKKEILHNILHIPESIQFEEPHSEYYNLNGYSTILQKNLEKLHEIDMIIELATLKNDLEKLNHYTYMKKLLITQNELISVSRQSHKIDLDISKDL